MIQIEEKLTLITPCFCAGADQKVAELRAPSIRGQLRWWFRVLGGTPEQEKELFGGVHGNAAASKIVVRIKDITPLHGKTEELPRQNAPLYYLFHFANASGKNKFDKNGPRYEPSGWLKEGTAFTVEVLSRQPMKPEEERQFLEAWNAFVTFGGLGLRQTRGLGSFAPQQRLDMNQLKLAMRELERKGVYSWVIAGMNGQPILTGNWKEAMIYLEAALGHVRQHGFKSNDSTPLGGGGRSRQASALHLRPVRLQEGYLPVLYYTPQVLAPQNARGNQALLDLLNGNLPCKVPYKQKPANPDTRNECRIMRV